MKHVMKSLKHNGIFVPLYDYKGFNVKINGQPLKLTPKSEQMAVAWVRKTLSIASPPDNLFKHNFMKEFLIHSQRRKPLSYLLKRVYSQISEQYRASFCYPKQRSTINSRSRFHPNHQLC